MTKDSESMMSGELLEEDAQFTLVELCRVCQVPSEVILALIDEGAVEPVGREPAQWRFHALSVRRIRCAVRLERDLGINPAGVALALDLIDEIEDMRARLPRVEQADQSNLINRR